MASKDQLYVFIGTYTRGESEGIYVYRFDGATCGWQLQSVTPDRQNPAYVAIHPNGRFLYAVNEVRDFTGAGSGAVSAYVIDEKTKSLQRLNQQASMGTGPCHLSVDPQGRCVLAANYGGGSVALLPLNEDGSLKAATSFVQHEGRSVDPKRQDAPHAHNIIFDPQARFALAADLGLDRIVIYRLDRDQGRLLPHTPPWASLSPGAGPRHSVFHPNGRFFYVINELDSTVTAFSYDGDEGRLTPLQTVTTLPRGFTDTNYCADIHIHPSGRYLYGSNRGHDSIVSYRVDPSTGYLDPANHYSTCGRTPRSFAIDTGGSFLIVANQDSDNIVVFRIDERSGDLRQISELTGVPTPACVKVM
ncbi:MAG: lactonase family protein [Limnochordia bacterium]|jgi:6-phosphogluconolactonase